MNNSQFIKTNFSQIYIDYYARMLRFAHSYLIEQEDAENLVQDVFTYVWENRFLLVEVQNIQAFLFTLLKRRCIDFLRKKMLIYQKQEELFVEQLEYQFKLSSLESVEDTGFFNEEMEEALYNAIAKLPEKCRHILIQSKLHSKKYQEIADEMGLSVQTVKNQVLIALHKLRSELQQYPLALILLLNNFYCK